MQNMIFQSALICPILTHFEKKIFFSKCVDLVPNLTHFENFFQIAYFFKVRFKTLYFYFEDLWLDCNNFGFFLRYLQ